MCYKLALLVFLVVALLQLGLKSAKKRVALEKLFKLRAHYCVVSCCVVERNTLVKRICARLNHITNEFYTQLTIPNGAQFSNVNPGVKAPLPDLRSGFEFRLVSK